MLKREKKNKSGNEGNSSQSDCSELSKDLDYPSFSSINATQAPLFKSNGQEEDRKYEENNKSTQDENGMFLFSI